VCQLFQAFAKEEKMKSILMVSGSRGYCCPERVRSMVRRFSDKEWILIHGDCPDSPDGIAGEEAERLGMVVGKFPYVSSLGRAGGHVRNRAMVDMADMCLFFWDGESSGTGKTIEYAKASGKDHTVFRTQGVA